MSNELINRIVKLSAEKCNLLIEVGVLEQARLKDAEDHEDSMRVLLKMVNKRGDIIRNQFVRADNWQDVATRANRKIRILESKIRYDNRSFASGGIVQLTKLCSISYLPINICKGCKEGFHS